MKARFQDHQDLANPVNGAEVGPSEAVALLRELRARQPFFCSLDTLAGTLLVGVGRNTGCVQHTADSAGSPPYLMATASSPSEQGIEFLSGGTPTPIPGRYCLPWLQVEDVVHRFLTAGVRPNNVVWEEI